MNTHSRGIVGCVLGAGYNCVTSIIKNYGSWKNPIFSHAVPSFIMLCFENLPHTLSLVATTIPSFNQPPFSQRESYSDGEFTSIP